MSSGVVYVVFVYLCICVLYDVHVGMYADEMPIFLLCLYQCNVLVTAGNLLQKRIRVIPTAVYSSVLAAWLLAYHQYVDVHTHGNIIHHT